MKDSSTYEPINKGKRWKDLSDAQLKEEITKIYDCFLATGRSLHRYGLSKCRGLKSSADELIQEVSEKIIKHLKKSDKKVGQYPKNMEAFLTTMIDRKHKDMFDPKRNRYIALISPLPKKQIKDIPLVHINPNDLKVDQSYFPAAQHFAIGKLETESHRKAIILKDYENYSYRQIGQELESSEVKEVKNMLNSNNRNLPIFEKIATSISGNPYSTTNRVKDTPAKLNKLCDWLCKDTDNQLTITQREGERLIAPLLSLIFASGKQKKQVYDQIRLLIVDFIETDEKTIESLENDSTVRKYPEYFQEIKDLLRLMIESREKILAIIKRKTEAAKEKFKLN